MSIRICLQPTSRANLDDATDSVPSTPPNDFAADYFSIRPVITPNGSQTYTVIPRNGSDHLEIKQTPDSFLVCLTMVYFLRLTFETNICILFYSDDLVSYRTRKQGL